MHTVIIICAGFSLLLCCLLLGHAWGQAAGLVRAAQLFMPLWLAAAVFNLWIGVSHAGYTVAEELPILLGVFAVPAAVAALVWWRMA